MQQALRQYVARVLTTHLAFLLAVAAVVALAGTMLYRSAQRQAEARALEDLREPAELAAGGVRRHLDAVIDVLDVNADAPRVDPSVLWDQLADRVSDLLLIESGGDALGETLGVARRFPNDRSDAGEMRTIFPNDRAAARFARDNAASLAPALSDGDGDGGASVFLTPPGRAGTRRGVVVAVPDGAGRALVAAVPAAYLAQAYLAPARETGRVAVLLVAADGGIVGGGGSGLDDRTLAEAADEGRVPRALADYAAARVAGRTLPPPAFEETFDAGAGEFDGALAVVLPARVARRAKAGPEPEVQTEVDVEVEADGAAAGLDAEAERARRGRLWVVALANRGAVLEQLEQLTRTAVLWALGLIVAVSAVLLSSGVQLVRGRSRLERLRTEMVDRELNEAREIQLRWLPAPREDDHRVGHRRVGLAATNLPASHVSGDFYNHFDLPGGRCALVIGDVTGHGMAAAFLMSTAQLLVRTILERTGGDPGRTLTEVNGLLARAATGGQFVTLLLCVLDADADSMRVASAGHAGPLACDDIGRWRELEVEGELVLGVMDGVEYPTHTVALDGSRALLLYTDGAVEAQDPDGRRFDLRQFAEGLRGELPGGPASAQRVTDAAIAVVRGFAGGRDFDDDVTLLAVHLSPQDADAGDAGDAGDAPEANSRGAVESAGALGR